jgi:hypothetical protein
MRPPAGRSKFFFSLFFAGVFLAFFGSCGIENYYYLYPVPAGNIHVELNSMATVQLPYINTTEFYYFTNFTVYYRIYISDVPESGQIQLSSSSLSRINPELSRDYFAFEPYLDSDTIVNTSIGTLFKNRNYHILALENADIEHNILSLSSARGNTTIIFNFSQTPGNIPFLEIGTRQYNLFRSDGGGLFTPRPDRYFVNKPELYDSQNINSTTNADVVNKPNISSSPRYTYVSLYIVVTGIDPNFSPIYSTPTFIGILRLPNPS